MAHSANKDKIERLQDHVTGINIDLSTGDFDCTACQMAKMRRKRNTDKRRKTQMHIVTLIAPDSSSGKYLLPTVWGPRDDENILRAPGGFSLSINHHSRLVSLFDTFVSAGNFNCQAPANQFDVSVVGARTPECDHDTELQVGIAPIRHTQCNALRTSGRSSAQETSAASAQPAQTPPDFARVYLKRHTNARPFECMFADHKSYECATVGGRIIALVIIDSATTAMFKYDASSKKDCGKCFDEFVAQWGVHKLPYQCNVYTDNCPSMNNLRTFATAKGIAHRFLSPKDPFMNMAELAIQLSFSAARAVALLGGISSYYMPYLVNEVLNKWFVLPTTARRQYVSPAQLIFFIKPNVSSMEATGTIVLYRKPDKSKPVSGFGDNRIHGVIAKLLCQRSVTDPTYIILMPKDKHYVFIHTRHIVSLDSTRPGGEQLPLDRPIFGQQSDSVVFPYAAERLPRRLQWHGLDTSDNAQSNAGTSPMNTPLLMPPTHHPPSMTDLQGNSIIPGTADESTAEVNEVTEPVTDPGTDPPPHTELVVDAGTDPPDEEIDYSASGDDSSTETAAQPTENQTGSDSDTRSDTPLVDGLYSDESESDEDLDQVPHYQNIGWKDHVQSPVDDIDELLANMVSVRPVYQLDTSDFDSLNYVLDDMDRKEEEQLLRQYNSIHDTDEASQNTRTGLCYKIAHKTMRKWRRRDPVPDDPIDWVGPIKDMPWAKVLRGSRRKDAIAAFDKEMSHLADLILEPILPDHAMYAEAVEKAQPGRFLLDLKRSGALKARGVQQGHLEDRSIDGPGFNYFARVADLVSIRCAFFRPDRNKRRIMTLDVSHAFLQSAKFAPSDPPRFIKFRNPITKETLYFLQDGPIYGSGSAPARWQNMTLAPWLQEIGFIRDANDPCIYRHVSRDINVCVYVDDSLIDVDSDSAAGEWFIQAFSQRFKCNDPEFLEVGTPIDFLGMDLHRTEDGYFISMENYIHKMLHVLDMNDCDMFDIPIAFPVTEFGAISDADTRWFMTACGCIGWAAMTCRIDVKFAHSRLSQHMSNPGTGAMELARRILGYLRKYPDLCLAQLNADVEAFSDLSAPWSWFVDSDHASNSEPQNKRRSQFGSLAICVRTPVFYSSQVHTWGKAHPKISEAHATTSSGESEVYGASCACKNFLPVTYKSEALNIPCPFPLELQIDNQAAIVYQRNTAAKSDLKHIDCRQEWVLTLRDAELFKATPVPTDKNLADFLTKIFPRPKKFEEMRDQLMARRSFK